MSHGEKMRQISKTMGKAADQKKESKVYVVSRWVGVGSAVGGVRWWDLREAER